MSENDDNWDAIFRPAQESAAPEQRRGEAASPAVTEGAPPLLSRRAARDARERPRARRAPRERASGARRRRWPWVLGIVLVLLLGGAAGGAWYVWTNYETQVREVLGWELPNDYEGTGNGTEVLVTIYSGEIGADVAESLTEQGVTMTFDAFYDLLLADPSISFIPGTYRLQEEMSAQSALDALLDPENKVELSATVREGLRAGEVIEALSAGTGIALEEYEAAIADPSIYGIPEIAPNIEGYLFPATYRFEPGTTAEDHIRTLVDEGLLELEELWAAAGSAFSVFPIAPARLVELSGAQVLRVD